MARAEIVEHDPCAGAAKRLEILAGDLEIGEQGRLRHLDLEPGRVEPGAGRARREGAAAEPAVQSWTALTLKDSRTAVAQRAASAAASASNLSLICSMTLICSAIGMNWSGGIRPRLSSLQRASASKRLQLARGEVGDRLEDEPDPVQGLGLAKRLLDEHPPAVDFVHLGREDGTLRSGRSPWRGRARCRRGSAPPRRRNRPAGARVSPQQPETRNSRPSTKNGSWSTAQMAAPALSAPLIERTRGSSKANSSPPVRAISAPSPTARARRLPIPSRTRSPAAWPNVSLIGLKPSRSTIAKAKPRRERASPAARRPSARRKARRLARPVRGSVSAISLALAFSALASRSARCARSRSRVTAVRDSTSSRKPSS